MAFKTYDELPERGFYEKEGELDPAIGGTRLAVPGPPVTRFSSKIDTKQGDLKTINEILKKASDDLPEGYSVNVVGGYNKRNIAGTDKPSLHSFGEAVDVEIIDPSGKKVPNIGRREGSPEYDLYKNLAISAYHAGKEIAPEFQLGWGGNFRGQSGGNAYDLMHFQRGDEGAGGSLAELAGDKKPDFVQADKAWRSREPVTASDKPGGRFAESGIAFEQGRGDTAVRYMDPAEYLALLPPVDDAQEGERTKGRSLRRSLKAGDEIEAIPTLEVSKKGEDAKIVDYDGRHRAQAALDAGLDAIPVAIRGIPTAETPKMLTGLTGKAVPFAFDEVPPVARDTSPLGRFARGVGDVLGVRSAQAAETRFAPPTDAIPPPSTSKFKSYDALPEAMAGPPGYLEREAERFKNFAVAPAYAAAGAARPFVGGAQALAHGAQALGIPGAATAAQGTDAAARGLEGFIERGPPEAPYLAMAGDIGATMLPAGRVARMLPGATPLGRAGAGIALGAATGATQPVTGQDYGTEKGLQVGLGAAFGPIVPGVADLARLVTPATLTQAAARLFGVDANRVTHDMLADAQKRIGGTLKAITESVDVPMEGKPLASLATIEAAAWRGAETFPQIQREISHVIDFIDNKGNIPGDVLHGLLFHGEAIDRMAKSAVPSIADAGGKIKGVLFDAIDDALAPAAKDTFHAARAEYRDLKLFEESKGIGQTRIDPKKYASRVSKHYRDEGHRPTATSPKSLTLGRVAGEIWGAPPEGRQSFGKALGTTVGALAGHLLLPGWGAFGGGFAGWHAAKIAENSLARLHLAKPEALRALRPGQPPFASWPIQGAPALPTVGAELVGNR